MKNVLTLLCVAMLAFVNVTFAQYGGGSTRSGGSSSALMKDNCPNGDTSGSYFDGDCGGVADEDEDTSTSDNILEDIADAIADNVAEEEAMDETDETSIFDILKDRGSSDVDANTSEEGSDGFSLPGMLAPTGADTRL